MGYKSLKDRGASFSSGLLYCQHYGYLMIPSRDDSYRENFYEASKDPLVEAIKNKDCGCYKTVKVCN